MLMQAHLMREDVYAGMIVMGSSQPIKQSRLSVKPITEITSIITSSSKHPVLNEHITHTYMFSAEFIWNHTKIQFIEQLRYHCSLTFQFSSSVLLLFLPNLNIIALSNRSPIKIWGNSILYIRCSGPVCVGPVGVARRQAALISPYGPVTTPERRSGRERGVPLLCSLIYDRPLWHALDHYHCGKDRKKAQGGCECVCYVCDQMNNLAFDSPTAIAGPAAADIAHKKLPAGLQGCRRMIRGTLTSWFSSYTNSTDINEVMRYVKPFIRNKCQRPCETLFILSSGLWTSYDISENKFGQLIRNSILLVIFLITCDNKIHKLFCS